MLPSTKDTNIERSYGNIKGLFSAFTVLEYKDIKDLQVVNISTGQIVLWFYQVLMVFFLSKFTAQPWHSIINIDLPVKYDSRPDLKTTTP